MQEQRTSREARVAARAMSGRETYFIQAHNGPVKIGLSTVGKTADRLKSLQTANAYVLELRCVKLGDREKEMHDRFLDLHIGGEWFYPGASLCRFANCKPVREIEDWLALDMAYDEGFRAGWRRASETLSRAAEYISDAVAMSMAEHTKTLLRRELVELPQDVTGRTEALQRSHSGRMGVANPL